MSEYHDNLFQEEFLRLLPTGFDLIAPKPDEKSFDRVKQTFTIITRKTKREVISFSARQMPGYCGILCVYYLRPKYAKETIQMKLFTRFLNLIILAAGNAKFGSVMLTQTSGSLGQITIDLMNIAGSLSFTNWKTNNRVMIYLFLTKAPKPKVMKNRFEEQ